MLGDGVLEDIDDGAGEIRGGSGRAYAHVEGDGGIGRPVVRGDGVGRGAARRRRFGAGLLAHRIAADAVSKDVRVTPTLS